jgi:hypothetical protein
MRTALAFWQGSTVPAASRSTQLRQFFTKCCLMSVGVLCLSAYQHEAQAQTVISQCTNPVCTPGKACPLYRCVEPRKCFDCTPPPSGGTSCVVGNALGNGADFAGGNVPDVLIESTDYWTIDDSGDVWYDGSSTTGPVQVTTITLPPSCVQTSGSFVLEDPLEEYEGSITMGTFTYQGLQTQFYAWPQVFYDDGDRSFIDVVDPDGNIDFYQYPWLSLGAYAVTGVDASTGDLFEGNGTVELLIEADVTY